MSADFPRIRFGQVMRPNSRPYTLGPDENANLVGMRLYGVGPFHREYKAAVQIVKKTHFVIRAGDIIYNKLFAWKGTFGIVPPELDGMFVSDKFPTYELDQSKVEPQYIEWIFRCPQLWEQARLLSTGSAALSKFTLNPPKFLMLEMPLPSLAEQEQIVARLNALASYIDNIRSIRSRLSTSASTLIHNACEAILCNISASYGSEPLNDLVAPERGISYGIVQTGQDVEMGVPTLRAGDLRWFECNTKGIKRVAPDIEKTYQRTRLQGGELLLRIRGGVGALAVCPPELAGANVSREIAVIPLIKHVDPRYAMYLLAAPSSQGRMAGHVKGTSYVGINLRDVRKLRLPVLPIPQQQRIVARMDKLRTLITELKRRHFESNTELENVMSSALNLTFNGKL